MYKYKKSVQISLKSYTTKSVSSAGWNLAPVKVGFLTTNKKSMIMYAITLVYHQQ